MRRRAEAAASTSVEMPPELAVFDPVFWGYDGPSHIDDDLVPAHLAAFLSWREARRRWCDLHPAPDAVTDVHRRNPDEPFDRRSL